MANLKNLADKIKQSLNSKFNDNQGWFQQGKFTPARKITNNWSSNPVTQGLIKAQQFTQPAVSNVQAWAKPQVRQQFNQAVIQPKINQITGPQARGPIPTMAPLVSQKTFSNPLIDKFANVTAQGTRALINTVPNLVNSFSNKYVYNPETKKAFPASKLRPENSRFSDVEQKIWIKGFQDKSVKSSKEWQEINKRFWDNSTEEGVRLAMMMALTRSPKAGKFDEKAVQDNFNRMYGKGGSTVALRNGPGAVIPSLPSNNLSLPPVSPIKTGEVSPLSPESKGIKIKPSEKIKINNLENKSGTLDTQTNQVLNTPIQKKTIKIKSTIPPETSPVSTQPSISQEPYLDSSGELQFPGIEKTKNIFSKPGLDITQQGQDKGSIIGGSGLPASPEVKQSFATWVNSRRASQIEGILKGREFNDLDSKGINGIFEFQLGNKTGRFVDIKKYFDDKFSELNTKGVNINYKQDYLPQMWNNSSAEVQQVFGNRLGLRPSFTLDSIIKNYKEGIEAGLTPKYTKVSDLIASYEARANKSLADLSYFETLKNDNIILPSSKAPLDWVTLDPDRFPKLSFTTDEGKYTGIYKAPEDIGTMINNYLANPSTSPNVFLKGLNSVANWTSSVKNRVLSFGIPGTAINAHGFNILARNVMSSKNPIEGAVTGIKYMLAPGTAVRDLDRQLTQFGPQAVKNGLTLSANEFKSVLEAPIGIKSKIGDVWDKLFERGLFDRMLPTLKLQKYKEVFDGFVKGGMNENEAGRAAAKFTNDVFGGINMEELGKSRDMQNLLRVTILAPDWMQTNINLAKNLPRSVIKISNPAFAPYRKFLATFIGTYITMNVVNKLSSGHWMYENDSGNTFNVEAGYTADGQKRYIRPFGTAADFIRIPGDVLSSLLKGDIQAPLRVIRNRLSIPLGVMFGAATDTDYTGKPIGYKGKDKYGNEIPLNQRLLGVGGEVATLAGMPAFAKQGLDYVSGKTKLEAAVLPGMELPFRYSGGAYSKTQQKITGILQFQGVTGKELYDANESIRGLTFSDKDIEKIKIGGLDAFQKMVISKQNSAKLNSELKGTGYTTSEDAPKNIISKTLTFGKAVITDPQSTLDVVIAGNPIRKVENGFVVLERSQGLGQLDAGNKATQIDHIVPLEFGGKNPPINSAELLAKIKGMTTADRRAYLLTQGLEELPVEQHKIKTAVQAELSKKLSRGEITKQDAKRMLENWREQLSSLTPEVKEALASDISVSKETADITGGKTYTITSEAGNDKEYDITTPIIKPAPTGLAEIDKINYSKYNSSITTRVNDIYKVMESGQITKEQANKLIADIKSKKSSSAGKKSTKSKGGKISIAKVKTQKISYKISKAKKKKLGVTIAKRPNLKQIKIGKIKTDNIKIAKAPKPAKIKGLSISKRLA